MKNNIIIAAKTFALKELNGNLSIESLTEALERRNYKIIVFSDEDKKKLWQKYFSARDVDYPPRAFTELKPKRNKQNKGKVYLSDALDYDYNAETKLMILLHEVAHVVVGHADIPTNKKFNHLLGEIEANAFVYFVLNALNVEVHHG